MELQPEILVVGGTAQSSLELTTVARETRVPLPFCLIVQRGLPSHFRIRV